MSTLRRTGAILVATWILAIAVGSPGIAMPFVDEPPQDAPRVNDIPGESRRGYGDYPSENPPERRVLLIYGWIDQQGFHVQGYAQNSPTRNLKRASDGRAFHLDPGDIIREIDGRRINSPSAYWKALEKASDPDNIELKIRDSSTGDDDAYYVRAKVIK